MSLRAKLLVSYASVIVLALVLAGTATIALRWREQQQAAVDRVIVAAPQISLGLVPLRLQNATQEQVAEYVRDEARQRDVRVLLVDRTGTVTADSANALRGKRLDVPAETKDRETRPFSYRVWDGIGAEQKGLTFLTIRGQFDRPPQARSRGSVDSTAGDRVVLAVPRQTLTNAWKGLLPGLVWAGLIALALSAVVAILLSRSIARPLQALTRASEEMARGNYDQEIGVRRRDEVGRLAAAFNEMARQVGRSHVQMRGLIANVSHDLKTPLTSILGFAQALRDGAVSGPEQSAETGAIIHEEAERVQALVDDLLYLSEIEAGQVIVAREPVDLSALAARSARRFEPSLRERGITLTVELPATLPAGQRAPAGHHTGDDPDRPALGSRLPTPLLVQGDTAKLERILDNLLDNARKYTPDGGRVVVRGEAAGTRPLARVSVFNSGSYIPPDDLARVFDRFCRADRARNRAGGSGLGLAIARELAELHGGRLTVASDAAGTTFTLTLPGHPPPNPRPDTSSALSDGGAGFTPRPAPSA